MGEQQRLGRATGQSVARRGMLAGVAATAAALLAKWTAQPAAAGADGDVVLGQNNVVGFPQPGIGTTSITVAMGKAGPAYLFEAKKPSESKGPWDYYKLVVTTPGDEAYRPLSAGHCPLVRA